MSLAAALLCLAVPAQAANPPAATEEKDFVRDTGFTYGAWHSCIIGGGGYVQNVVPCPSNPRRYYAYVDVGGAFRSDDGGKSWRMLHGHLPARGGVYDVRGMLVDPRDDKKIILVNGGPYGKKEGVYLSDDAGETWRKSLDALFLGNCGNRWSGFVLARNPKNPDIVVAFSFLDGVFRSTDNGQTWQHAEGADGLYPTDLRFDEGNPSHLWLCASNGKVKETECTSGFFQSEDGGLHWQKVSPEGQPVPSETVQDPKDAKKIYGLFGSSMIRLTQDGGKTWTDFSDGLPLDPANGKPASISPFGYRALTAGPDFILTANTKNSDFFRLKSGETKWEKVPKQGVNWGDWFHGKVPGARGWVFGAALGSITVDPHDANHWFCTDYYTIYQTFDAGKNWTLTTDGIEVTVIHTLEQDPSNPNVVHLGMADCGYFLSEDGGRRFHAGEGITNNVKCITVARQQPTRVYAVGPEKQGWASNCVFVSNDRGQHWARAGAAGLPDMNVHHCNSIAADPRDPQTVYVAVSKAVGANGGGVYRSKNGGRNWEWYGQGLPEGQEFFHYDIWTVGREIAVGANGALVAMSFEGKGVYYHPPGDGGQWMRADVDARKMFSVVAVPGNGSRFALGGEGGVFLSDDGGQKWRCAYDKPVHHVTADEARPGRLAAGTADGVVLSEDGGATWKELDKNLPYRVYDLVAFAGDRLVAGSGGSGAFWMPLTATAGQPLKTAATEINGNLWMQVQNPAPSVAAPSAPPVPAVGPVPASPEPEALPVPVTAADPAVRYSGRFKKGKAGEGMTCQWPASAVTLRFAGTDLNVHLNDNNGQSRWQVVLDGQPSAILSLKKGAHTYRVAAALTNGEHTAQLVKCTESFFGITKVNGFELNAGGHALPAVPPRHRLEVVGDSISCGYGVEAASQAEHLTPGTENAWLAYGAVAARQLDADYTCLAWSGKKLFPNNTIIEYYGRTLPTAPGDDWDFKQSPAPDVVVITLGTNDLGKVMPEEAGWTDAYKAFIARVRQNYPDVTVYCATSPMLSNGGEVKKRTVLHDWLAKIVDGLTAAGDKKVHLLDFPSQDAKNGLGGDYHPSAKTQAINGAQLAATIKKDLGW